MHAAYARYVAPFLLLLSGFLSNHAFALPSVFTGSEADFYELPAGTPTAAPGTVVRWQPYTPSIGLTANSDGVIAYRMLYVSTGAQGQKTLVSGSVLVPVRVYAPSRPLVGFAAGTQGMADSCASSHGLQNSNDYDIIYMRQALDKGWAIAATDYQGLGTKTDLIGNPPDEHTYIVGQVLGRNVLDATRAAVQFNAQFDADRARSYPLKFIISGNMSLSSKVVLWGYSEGGGGAAWAGELQPTYAPELKLVGIAAGGTPADILAAGNAANKRTSVAFGVVLAAAIGFKQAYPELTFETKLNAAGLAQVASVKQQCIIDIVLHNFGGHVVTDYTVGGFSMLTDSSWLARFAQNKLGNAPPKVPTFMYHATLDEAVDYTQARDLARTYCSKGVQLSWNPYVGDHITVFAQGMGDALNFLSNRLLGLSTSTTACSAIQ